MALKIQTVIPNVGWPFNSQQYNASSTLSWRNLGMQLYISTVRPAVRTNPPEWSSVSKSLFNREKLENTPACRRRLKASLTLFCVTNALPFFELHNLHPLIGSPDQTIATFQRNINCFGAPCCDMAVHVVPVCFMQHLRMLPDFVLV